MLKIFSFLVSYFCKEFFIFTLKVLIFLSSSFWDPITDISVSLSFGFDLLYLLVGTSTIIWVTNHLSYYFFPSTYPRITVSLFYYKRSCSIGAKIPGGVLSWCGSLGTWNLVLSTSLLGFQRTFVCLLFKFVCLFYTNIFSSP